MAPYTDLPDLAEVVLEESWVLAVEARPREVAIRLELVLTEHHPRYRPPAPGDRYAPVHGTLVLAGVSALTWTDQAAVPATDATGEVDLGHVDAMSVDGHRYRLEGDVGVLEVEAEQVVLHLDPHDPSD